MVRLVDERSKWFDSAVDLNALYPILVRVLGKDADVSELQLWKASSGMAVMLVMLRSTTARPVDLKASS